MLLTELSSKNQERIVEDGLSHWRQAGLETRASDRAAAEAGVLAAYKVAGLKPPKIILWLGSPRAAATAVRLLYSDIDWPVRLDPFQRAVWDDVWKQSVRQVEAQVSSQKWHQVRSEIRKKASKEIEDKYGQFIEKQVKAIFAERLSIWVWQYLRNEVGKPQLHNIRTRIEEHVQTKVGAEVSPKLLDHILQQVIVPLRQQLWVPIVEPLRQAISINNGILSGRQTWDCCWGQHDADWVGYYDVLTRLGVKAGQHLDGIKRVAASSGWWWPFENVCILSERPRELHRDNRGRLHHETGKAIEYPDGWGLYAWHGILVPEHVITLPEPITFEMIESETNAEVKRVLIERFGLDNYLRAGKCIKIHQDKCGTLYRMNLPGDEPILVVQVINSTPEPDGVFKEYFLRVPPNMTRARQAVAWTFGLTEEEYYPLAET